MIQLVLSEKAVLPTSTPFPSNGKERRVLVVTSDVGFEKEGLISIVAIEPWMVCNKSFVHLY